MPTVTATASVNSEWSTGRIVTFYFSNLQDDIAVKVNLPWLGSPESDSQHVTLSPLSGANYELPTKSSPMGELCSVCDGLEFFPDGGSFTITYDVINSANGQILSSPNYHNDWDDVLTGPNTIPVTVPALGDITSQTTSSSLNSYTEPHSGFVFKYPDTLEGLSFNVETNQPTNSFNGIQILSMKSTDDYGVCNNCILLEYTIKNTTPYYISYINLNNQLYQNDQSLMSSGSSVMDVGNYNIGGGNRVELAPGDTGVLSTRVTWDGLLNRCSSYTSGKYVMHR